MTEERRNSSVPLSPRRGEGRGEGKTLLFFLLLTSCQLAPLNIEGLACIESTECGTGYDCYEKQCVREGTIVLDAGTHDAGTLDAGIPDAGTQDAGVDAGIPDAGPDDAGTPRGVNLLINPGFELLISDGGVQAWRTSPGRLSTSPLSPRTGQRTARVLSTAATQQPTMVPLTDVPGTEFGTKFCGSVWLRANDDAGSTVVLQLRERFPDGGSSSRNAPAIVLTTNWQYASTELAANGGGDLQFRVAGTKIDAGDDFYVDDAWLSLAPGSTCPP